MIRNRFIDGALDIRTGPRNQQGKNLAGNRDEKQLD
jgi:hypothetical protein